MAVILAYGSPALGHLYPLSALLCELAQRGHQVHLRTMSTEVATMRRARFHTEAVDPRIEAIVGRDLLARNALGVLKMSIDVLCRRAVIEVDDLRRAITRIKPDAVIVDANCWGAMSVAEASDVPWLVFTVHALLAVARSTAIWPRSAATARCRRGYPRCVDTPVCEVSLLSLRSPDSAGSTPFARD